MHWTCNLHTNNTVQVHKLLFLTIQCTSNFCYSRKDFSCFETFLNLFNVHHDKKRLNHCLLLHSQGFDWRQMADTAYTKRCSIGSLALDYYACSSSMNLKCTYRQGKSVGRHCFCCWSVIASYNNQRGLRQEPTCVGILQPLTTIVWLANLSPLLLFQTGWKERSGDTV